MIIMIILTLGTILFSFVSSITLGFSIRVMKSKIKMIFQIGSKNGGYFLEPLRIFSILKFLTVTNTSLNMGVTWFLTSCSQVLFFLSRFQIPWILCWDFVLSQMIPASFPMHLKREFKVKWWSNFSHSTTRQSPHIFNWIS